MRTKALTLLVLSSLLIAPGCGGDGTSAQLLSSISGRVSGPVTAGANVSVRPLLNTGALGDALGAGVTDAEGYFAFELSGYEGPAVILTRGGEYTDLATGDTIVADEFRMASLVVLVAGEEHTAYVTPVTTIAALRAVILAVDPTVDARSALENGIAIVEEYYGIEGIVTTLPADLTVGTVPAGNEADYGALNAGLSQLADDRDDNLWSLLPRLAEDGSDGTFDGHFFAGPIEGLDQTTGGAELEEAIAAFMDGSRNASGLDAGDISVEETIWSHGSDEEYNICLYQPRIDVVDPPSGVVNEITEVTLYGQFPDRDNVSLVVTFGGVVAEVVDGTWSDDIVRVRTPALPLPGKADVEVRCQNTGVHGISPRSFEYYVPDLAPVITGVTPAKGPEAGGTLLEVTGQNFDPKSIVEVNGTQADTIARLGRTVLVVAAPPGSGQADVTVRQADVDGSPSATLPDAFSYGAADEPAEADLAGSWKAYGLGHMYEPETVMLVESDIVFSAGGTFNQDGDIWFATAATPAGQTEPMQSSGPFRVFADGTLWMQDPDQPANRSFLSPENDAFIAANDGNTSGPMWLGVGIRRGSGMSNASLAGNWYFGLFTHAYATDSDDRTISSAWGTAEFDGQGHGSAGLIGSFVTAAPESERTREAFSTTLTYHVNSDGTFTVTIPAEEGDEPVVFRGSLAQARDLGVAVSASGGEAQLLMMVPCPVGFTPAHAQGNWYGGGLAYDYHPANSGSNFNGETIRSLADGRGEGVAEVLVRMTSDESVNEGMHSEVHLGWTLCETNGFLIGGPDDLSGFVGTSQRFQIAVPANLEASPYEDPVRFMGASLLVRRPATYSSWTLDDKDFNAAGISTRYRAPDDLSYLEENRSFRSQIYFGAGIFLNQLMEPSMLIGRTHEYEGRIEKIAYRDADTYVDSYVVALPESYGWYAVFGDGRMLMSVDEPPVDRLAVDGNDTLRQIVGEIAGNGDLILLRNAVNPYGESAIIALGRAASGTPELDGAYNGGALRFNIIAEQQETAEAALGSMVLDSDGTLSGDGWLYTEDPVNGMETTVHRSWSDTLFAVDSGGFVSLRYDDMELDGFMTPDGQAIVLVDLVENLETTFLVALKRPLPDTIAAAGSYRWEGFAHDYLDIGALPIEARKHLLSGPGRVTGSLDVGVAVDERSNEFPHVNSYSTLFDDNSLVVNPDGSVSWNRGSEVYRGWFSANGRYAFLMPTEILTIEDVPYITPYGQSLHIAIR